VTVVCAVSCLALACSGSDGSSDATDASADTSEVTGVLPFHAFYVEIQQNALGFVVEDGNWAEDFGDASYYGPAYYMAEGMKNDRDEYVEIGFAGLQWDMTVIDRANEDIGYFMSDLEEVLMAAYSVIEIMSITGSTAGLEKLDALVDLVNTTAEGFGMYIDADIPSYALDTYGPTVVTASIALLNLRYAELLDTPRTMDRLDFGLKVIEAADKAVWSGTMYRFRPGEDKLYLYPNATMMLSNATAYMLTEEDAYLQRCIDAHAGIQPLKDPKKGSYNSPYSAEFMGAKTDEYSTLSVHNFTMMALALLYRMTGDAKWQDEIVEIEGFIEGYLYDASVSKILHHWMDGRIAEPEDPEYWCSGCNLQFLYVCRYLEEYVFGGEEAQ